MRRALVLATLLAVPTLLSGQPTSILRVTVTLPDEAQQPTPVLRYVLLISDNPATTVPRRVLTGPDGTLSIPLIPGSYTIESDRPATFAGKAYEWTQMIDVVAGRTVTLALTAENADVVTVTGPAPVGTETPSSAPSFQAGKWLDSVVAIWSPTSRATGFLVDARGLIATRGLAAAKGTMVAVQVSGELKVAARVLLSDPARDVAIVWVHPTVIAGRTPVALGCQVAPAALAGREEITALTAPFGRLPDVESGEVTESTPFAIETDLRLGFGGAGGPIFNDAGTVVGLTSLAADRERSRLPEVTVVRAGVLCEAVAAAQPALSAGMPPEPIKLPIEPRRSDPAGSVQGDTSTGARTPSVVSSSDFDVAFITPLLIQQALQNDRTGGRSGRSPEAEARIGRLTEFGAWSEYFADLPAVVIVRVTPKMVEGFWKRLGREAARTQGADLPPFKDFKTSFVRMRASCGGAEVVPIQPFVLEHRTSDTKMIREGLYVFDPAAFGPACSRVTLSIYSEKAPEKADSVTIDVSLIRG